MPRIIGKFPEPGDHAVFSKELTPTRLHVLSPRCHNYGASDQTFCILCTQKPRDELRPETWTH